MDAPADLMDCGHPKGCMVSSETDSICGWCCAVRDRDTAENDLKVAMKQNRKQDTALRVIRDRTNVMPELISSALCATGGLMIDGTELDVDDSIACGSVARR